MSVASAIKDAIAGAIAPFWAFIEAGGRVRHEDAQEKAS
jgi:hypothetical protein